MEENNSEEIDLGFVIKKIGDSYRNLLVRLYRVSQFLIKNWIVLLILIIAGVVVGYFLDKYTEPTKETSLIVQINFKSSNYVYDAIEQLNGKIKEYDTLSLSKLGFYDDGKLSILEVEIEPIVNILDILEDAPQNDRNVEVLLEQSQYEEDLLTSEVFIPEYQAHRIFMKVSPQANEEVISNLLRYLNTNEILNRIKEITISNTKRKIERSNQSIALLDSILKVYGTIVKGPSQGNQVSFSSYDVNNGNIHLMFREKVEIQDEIETLEVELIKYDNIVETLNKPMLQIKDSLFANKTKTLPGIFVLLFLVMHWIKNIFNKAKKLSENL